MGRNNAEYRTARYRRSSISTCTCETANIAAARNADPRVCGANSSFLTFDALSGDSSILVKKSFLPFSYLDGLIDDLPRGGRSIAPHMRG